MAGDVGAERESNSCLKGSSEALLSPSPSGAVLDSNLVDRDNLERRSSFEGNFAPFCGNDANTWRKEVRLSLFPEPQFRHGLHQEAAYELN